MNVLLINPPVVKPSEPPAGLARLAATLRAHHVSCHVLDANLEGMLALLQMPCSTRDTWTRRAGRALSTNLSLLRSAAAWQSFDRYQRAVLDCNRVLAMNARGSGVKVSFADYRDEHRSPLRIGDLLEASQRPVANPFFPYFSQRLACLLAETPNLVGFSVNFLSQALTAFAMAGFIRAQCSKVKIVLGGGLITSWVRRGLRGNPFSGLVDELIDGPGEARLLALCGQEAPSRVVMQPDYTGLPDPVHYLSPTRILPYSGSSGCYWNRCAFCPEQAEGTPYVPIVPEQMCREVQALVHSFHPGLVHFLDNALSPAHLTALIRNPPGIPWYGFARITKELTDPEYCRSLRQAGCCMLQLGIESGDDEVLEALHKGITTQQIEQALRSIHSAGIAVYAYLLFGTPPETYELAMHTRDLVVRLSSCIDFVNCSLFNMPLAGFAKGNGAEGLFYDADLSLYRDFAHPQGWTRANVRRFFDREFKRHPVIAGMVRRDPPLFTSNHAPFFCTGWQESR